MSDFLLPMVVFITIILFLVFLVYKLFELVQNVYEFRHNVDDLVMFLENHVSRLERRVGELSWIIAKDGSDDALQNLQSLSTRLSTLEESINSLTKELNRLQEDDLK